MNQNITIAEALKDLFPKLRLGCIWMDVSINQSDDRIYALSDKIIAKIQEEITIDQVSQRTMIRPTKEAYRKLGKDPSRYRPSAEALTRRILKGKDLLWINNIVDILNLISLDSGYSIGGYDADKISGDVEFGIGKVDEPYEAIGRGTFNIENLPVFRDEQGAFGSPTSDSLRTMVTDSTANFLMIIIDFLGDDQLKKTVKIAEKWYTDYADSKSLDITFVPEF
jgi:DNA/RNA-binding domain of Phe-tRNA-synthetase-like protein